MRRLPILALSLAFVFAQQKQDPAEEKPKLEPLKTSITVTAKIDALLPGTHRG